MPLAAATIANLESARDNLAATLAAQTLAWVAAGRPPTYSIDGESWSWDQWVQTMTKDIQSITETINKISAPFIVRSRGRV
jgi:hypothetical protein